MNSRSIPALATLLFSAGLILTMAAQTPAPKPQAATPTARQGFGGAGGNYKTYPPEVLENGKKAFTATCAFCHGGNANGGESGPSLLRSPLVLHDEDGKEIGAFIKVGRPDKGMPAFKLPDAEVSDLAAFLHDSVRAAAERGTYKILDIVVGDPKAGEAYFNGAGGCASCHSVTGDLAHIGSKLEPADLQQKIVMPRDFRSADRKTAMTVTVTQANGDSAEGVLKHLDDFSVTLIGKDGNAITYPRESPDMPKVETHDPLKAHVELLSKYTDADIHNLTAYLLTLK